MKDFRFRVISFLIIIGGLSSVISYGQQQSLIPFEMSDQFEKVHSSDSSKGKTTVIVISDREGRGHSENWGRAIRDLVNDLPQPNSVSIYAVAHVEGTPSFLRSFVQKIIRSDRKQAILLDWKGQVKRAYGLEESQANILLFSPEGKLTMQFAAEEVTPNFLKSVQDHLGSIQKSN